MTCVTNACASEFTETLFDGSYSSNRPREAKPFRQAERFFAATNLFDFLPELSRRLKQEFVHQPEEDLERWDGQS
jgi:hypothetical protein